MQSGKGELMSRTRLVGVSIADLQIAIEAPPGLPWRLAGEPLAAFAAPVEEVDLHLGVRVGRVDRGRRPLLAHGLGRDRLEVRPLGKGWQVLQRRRGRVEREARLDADLSEGVVIVDAEAPAAKRCGYPLGGALDRWLVRHRLARSGGLLIPACAAVRDGRATLFAGPPGAGKTRLARALAEQPGVRVLAHHEVALRAEGTGFRVHATPWSEPAAAGSAPLESVHLLRPGPFAAMRSLDGTEAVAALLGLVPPLDEPGAQEGVLAAVERLAERVPVTDVAWATVDDPGHLAWGCAA
jgi:hypothetical protein